MPIIFATIKLAVLFFYRRIFVGRVFKWYSSILSFVLVAWALAFAFAFAFQCGTHPEWWWTSLETIAKCNNSAWSNLGFAVSDVATDLLVLVTPLPIIWKLQRGVGDKIGLSLIFGLGLLSTAAAMVRMGYIIHYDWSSVAGARDLLGMCMTFIIRMHCSK